MKNHRCTKNLVNIAQLLSTKDIIFRDRNLNLKLFIFSHLKYMNLTTSRPDNKKKIHKKL